MEHDTKGVTKGAEELKKPQGEESGGQKEIEGALGERPEGAPENVPGNEPGNGTGVEDGTEEDGQKRDKGKGQEKAF
ncbi:hypothetical protein ID866_8548 [Astraeus odoratus]|nr:hypothetical protein ID866_8548 [Astraeus odoratus]